MTRSASTRPVGSPPIARSGAHAAGSTGRLQRLIRPVAGLLALAAVLGVPPLLLSVLVGDPLPQRLPDSHMVSSWLRAPLTDTMLLHLMALICWAAWAHLLLCLLSEALWQIRGRSWHIPLGSVGSVNQRLAQHLIASVLLTAPTAHALSPLTALRPAVVTTQDVAATATHLQPTSPLTDAQVLRPMVQPGLTRAPTGPAATPTDSGRPTTSGQPTTGATAREIVVAAPHGRHHDTLWDIADRELGDPLRWQEIFALNDGRLMTDGQRLTRASLIRPGWVLRLPHDPQTSQIASPAPKATPPPPPAAAEDTTPAVTPDHDVAPAPPIVTQAPPVRAPVPAPVTIPRVEAPDPVGPSYGTEAPPQQQPIGPLPSVATGAAATPAVSGSQPTPGAMSAREPASATTRQQHVWSIPAAPVTAGLGIGALGLLTVLERRRRIAARRRPVGTRLHLPTAELVAAEHRIRTQARDATAVSAAIRLALTLVADRDPSLVVRALWHTPEGSIELLLDRIREAPAPFVTTDGGWSLPAAAQGFLFAITDRADPAPTLLPVGQRDGAVCYVNLEPIGLVGLDGPANDVNAVLAGLAQALAGAPWANMVQTVVPEHLQPAVLGLEHVDVLTDPPTRLDRLSQYATAIDRQLSDKQQDSVAGARNSGADDCIAPMVLIGLAPEQVPVALVTAALRPTSPILAVLAGPHPDAQIWHLTGGQLTVPGIAEHLQPLRADYHDIDGTEALLTQALDASPAPADDPALTALAIGSPPQIQSQAIEVCVLGPVELIGTGAVRRTQVLSIVVFLAMHRRFWSGPDLGAALWPDWPYNGHVLRTRLHDVTQLLGPGSLIKQGRSWQLADTVGSDWQHFQALTGGDEADRAAALELVRGLPFSGLDTEWVHTEGHARLLECAVVDLALDVAQRALDRDDSDAATAAVDAGLRCCPYDERLYQLGMQAAGLRGASSEVKALRRQLDRVMDEQIEPDDQIQPATLATYEELTRRRPDQAPRD